MNWEAIGAIGEILGAIAVLLTLAYLAAQIRQNTNSVRTSTFQQVVSDMAHAIEQLNQNADLNRIWYAGLRDFEGLEQLEKQRFATYITSILRRYENILYQSREGTLDSSNLEGLIGQMSGIMSSPGTQVWWSRARGLFNTELQDHVDNELIVNGEDA